MHIVRKFNRINKLMMRLILKKENATEQKEDNYKYRKG